MKKNKYRYEKKSMFFVAFMAFIVSACGNKEGETDSNGTFQATEILVSAQVQGVIESFLVEEGFNVKANECLGHIDTIQYYLKKIQFEAAIQSARSRLSDVDIQTAVLNEQLLAALTEQRRLESLVLSNAATGKQLDDINSKTKVLRKQINAAIISLESANSSIMNEIEGLKAQLGQINDYLSKSYIYSPIDGTVLLKYAQEGELASPGKVLFKVASLDRMRLRIYLTGNQLAMIRVGQSVRVNAELGQDGNKLYRGIVTRISDKSEFTPKSIQTRDERSNLVYAVDVSVPNDGDLKIGMYGGIYIDK